MVCHENMLSMHGVFKNTPEALSIDKGDRYLSFLPLPHIFDRILVTSFALSGGEVFFYGGDILKLN